MTNKSILMVDPPSGWKYGFPKPLPNPKPENMVAWLVENGYPQEEIDSYGDYFYCRYFGHENLLDLKEKCPAGNWRDKCDDWECVSGCRHEK